MGTKAKTYHFTADELALVAIWAEVDPWRVGLCLSAGRIEWPEYHGGSIPDRLRYWPTARHFLMRSKGILISGYDADGNVMDVASCSWHLPARWMQFWDLRDRLTYSELWREYCELNRASSGWDETGRAQRRLAEDERRPMWTRMHELREQMRAISRRYLGTGEDAVGQLSLFAGM